MDVVGLIWSITVIAVISCILYGEEKKEEERIESAVGLRNK